MALGRDFAAIVAARFRGRVYAATFSKETPGIYDPQNAAGSTSPTVARYVCDGIAFGYEEKYIDGEHITEGDYRVIVLRGTIQAVLDDAVKATLDLGTVTVNVDSVLRARAAGATGNGITVELVADAGSAAGQLVEVGTNVKLRYLAGATTVADIEALTAGSVLLEIDTPGTAATLLDSVDVISSTPLAGGSNPTSATTGVVPGDGDTINIPPPGGTVAKQGVVIRLEALTEAFATVQVRGASVDG